MYSCPQRFGAFHEFSKSYELIPTGIPTLDYIIGGYPCGSVVLILEDEFRAYSEIVLNFFLAEGIANSDDLFIGSKDIDPTIIVSNLPPTNEGKDELLECVSEELTIAWRYQNACPIKSIPENKKAFRLSHDFDMYNKVSPEKIEKLNIRYWPCDELFTNVASLLDDIQKTVVTNCSNLASKYENLNVLRIAIHNFASPFWLLNKKELLSFLYKIRALVHNSRTVLLFSISKELHSQELIERCIHISDIAISLNSLASSYSNLFSDYNGLIKLVKLSSVNSLSSRFVEDTDWAFRVKRKKIIIEKLHLPPEASDSSQREQDDGPISSRPNCQFYF